MIYLQIFIEFIKIGLFAIGGGMAALPFLYELSGKYNWYTREDVTNMLAISESTPGPIGINMSTFVGYNIGGIAGSLLATLSITIPGIIISLIVYIFLEKFRSNPTVEAAFYGIRPVVTAMISIALIEVLKTCVITLDVYRLSSNILNLVNLKSAAVFAVFIFLIRKFKKHPILYISCGALLGIFVKF